MHVNARAIIERSTPDGVEIVVQVRNKPYEGGKWIELPGGRVEEFESLVEALRREVREETGLMITSIESLDTRIETDDPDTCVECLQPFAVYQTIRGPVDSMGVYFRCQAEGELLVTGDETEDMQWMSVQRVAELLDLDAHLVSWVDRAGLRFYLEQYADKPKRIPSFANEDEEREFWATHDSTEYINWDEATSAVFPHLTTRDAPALRFAVCIDNSEYPVSLERYKVYRVLSDPDTEQDGDLRVIDESGEDYLYPRTCFVLLDLPHNTVIDH